MICRCTNMTMTMNDSADVDLVVKKIMNEREKPHSPCDSESITHFESASLLSSASGATLCGDASPTVAYAYKGDAWKKAKDKEVLRDEEVRKAITACTGRDFQQAKYTMGTPLFECVDKVQDTAPIETAPQVKTDAPTTMSVPSSTSSSGARLRVKNVDAMSPSVATHIQSVVEAINNLLPPPISSGLMTDHFEMDDLCALSDVHRSFVESAVESMEQLVLSRSS